MALGLSRVFSGSGKRASLEVTEPALFGIADAQEAYYQYLFPKTSSKPLTLPQKLVVDVVKDSIQKKSVRAKAVPRLPHIIPKLMRSLRDPDSSAKDYVDIVNKDPVMSAAVLKLANSAYFNPIGRRIDDIEVAVVKLGIEGLRAVLSAAVMQPVIQKETAYFSQSGQRIWSHSLSCAVCCELIGEQRGQEKFKVYLMGLVHDIGKITLFSELCKQFKANGEEVQPGYNAFVPVMKLLSPAVSYWIAKDWELPADICKALAEQLTVKAGAKISPYGHTLYQANMVAEVYTTKLQGNEQLARDVLIQLDLPSDLFDKLDSLSKEL